MTDDELYAVAKKERAAVYAKHAPGTFGKYAKPASLVLAEATLDLLHREKSARAAVLYERELHERALTSAREAEEVGDELRREVQRLKKIERAARAILRTKKPSEEYPQLEAALSEEPPTKEVA